MLASSSADPSAAHARFGWPAIFGQAILILFIAIIPAGLAAFLHPNRPDWSGGAGRMPRVSLEAAQQWGDNVLWVDARPLHKHEQAHIKNAIHLSQDMFDSNLMQFLDAWGPGHRVVVYCDDRNCGASEEVARRLTEEVGIADVHVLDMGWQPD